MRWVLRGSEPRLGPGRWDSAPSDLHAAEVADPCLWGIKEGYLETSKVHPAPEKSQEAWGRQWREVLVPLTGGS